jgi:hypothetical protein
MLRPMNTKRQLTIIGITVAILSLTAFSDFDSSIARTVEVSKFLILIQNTDNGLKLKCEEGCAWKELSFSLKDDKFQAVDQYGMTTIDRDKPSDDDKLSNFLFEIQRTKNGISFGGKEGTAWTKLNFSCPDNKCNQYIDQYGMTTKD